MKDASSQKMNKLLGKRIKYARKETGFSQKKLSNYLKVSDKAISAYEVGRTTPSFAVLKKISKLTHKPLSYFDTEEKSEDLDLQIKLKTIEKELLEIKQLLKKRK